jgi:hypothetical protein
MTKAPSTRYPLWSHSLTFWGNHLYNKGLFKTEDYNSLLISKLSLELGLT